MTNKKKSNIEKSISELEKLFLHDLIPETLEEAHEILNEAEFNTMEFKENARNIFRNMLTEFDDDWRNTSEETLNSKAKEILKRDARTDLPRETLLDKIKEITQLLDTKGLTYQLSAGVVHRNLEKEVNEDLASLLRQLEHIAEQAGIDLGEK